MPLVGRDRNVDPVAALAADNVERAADAVDGLVEHDVVFERVGADDIIIVGISGAPDEARRTILGTGDGLELHLDEAVLDVGIVLEKQRVSRLPGLFNDPQFRRRGLVLLNRPFRLAPAGFGRGPAFRSCTNRVCLEPHSVVCHGGHLPRSSVTTCARLDIGDRIIEHGLVSPKI